MRSCFPAAPTATTTNRKALGRKEASVDTDVEQEKLTGGSGGAKACSAAPITALTFQLNQRARSSDSCKNGVSGELREM